MKKLLIVLLWSCSLLALAADDRKLSQDLRDKSGDMPVNVIVQYAVQPAQRHKDRIVALGGQVNLELHVVKGVAVSLPARQLRALSSDPDVSYVSSDRVVTPSLNYVTAAVNASYAWQSGYNGSGIAVAVIDSGINTSGYDFNTTPTSRTSRVVYSQNFTTDKNANDGYGHGTHVASIIAGNGAASICSTCFITFKGMAPAANLINLKVLNGNGLGQDSWVISAIQSAINLKSKYNIRVINLSLGRPVYESYTQDPLCKAVEQAWNAGIVVVVAAGNDGRNNSAGTEGYVTINAPGNDPYAITVGAMKTQETLSVADDNIASYSSKGPTLIDHIAKPDIVAPGNRVVARISSAGYLVNTFTINQIPYSYYESPAPLGNSLYYYKLSGTSMATGVVSGAVADLLQANPALTPDQAKARLMKTANKSFPQYSSVYDPSTGITYPSQYDVFTVGAGYLDLAAAMTNTDVALLPAKSPTVAYDSSSQSVYFVNDSASVWGSSSLWGSASVWGSQAFVGTQSSLWGSAALWGSASVWGSSSDQGFASVWGSAAIWGSSTKDGGESTTLLVNGEN